MLPYSQTLHNCQNRSSIPEVFTPMELSADYPASHSVWQTQQGERAKAISATFSITSSDCFAMFDQAGQLLKMFQGCSQFTLDGSLEIYSGKLPKQGMMCDGKLYPLPTVAEFIEESGCGLSLLPTPVKSDSSTAAIFTNGQACDSPTISGSFLTQGMLFKQNDSGTYRKISNNGIDGSVGLTRTLKLQQMLPTPVKGDRNTAGVKSHKKGQTRHLSIAVREYVTGRFKHPNLFGCHVLTVEETDNRYLNPSFVEQMMGFPQEWTNLNISNEALKQAELLPHDNLESAIADGLTENAPHLRDRLAQLGNAVCPQVAAIPFLAVAGIIEKNDFNFSSSTGKMKKTKPIAFTKTVSQLLAGKKTVTRRDWKKQTAKTYAQYYEQKQLVPAYDRQPRNGGKQIAWLKLTKTPYQQRLSDIRTYQLKREGGTCKTATEFIDRYFDGRDREVWVIEFEVVEILSDFISDRITQLQEIIISGVADIPSFYKVGKALKTVKEEKLYKQQGYDNLLEYCREIVPQLQKSQIYNLINAVEVRDNLGKLAESVPIGESHCTVLKKLKSPELQRQALSNAIELDRPFSKNLLETEVRKLCLQHKSEATNKKLPEVGTILRITSHHNPELKLYKSYWGVVTEVNTFSCLVRVHGMTLLVQNPFNDASVITGIKSKEAIALLDRLDAIACSSNDATVRNVLKEIATSSYPQLTEWQEYLLNAIEDKIGNQ